MGDQKLAADLDARGRLLPGVQELAELIKAETPDQIASGEAAPGTVPSLAAAQAMSQRALPIVQLAVAGRFCNVAEMIELARLGFLTTDEQLQTVVNTVWTLKPWVSE